MQPEQARAEERLPAWLRDLNEFGPSPIFDSYIEDLIDRRLDRNHGH